MIRDKQIDEVQLYKKVNMSRQLFNSCLNSFDLSFSINL